MVQVKEFRLVRVDPRMMHIVASEDIGPIPKIGEGGWLREGDTSGSRVGKDWHESRRKTPVSGCVRITSLPLVSSSCIPIGRPSVGPNFGELRKTEVQLRRIPLPRTWVNKAQNYTLSSDSLQDQGQIT